MTKPDRVVENWETIAVTALPAGWRNVYRDGETKQVIYTPCPALLLQEHRYDKICTDHPKGDGTFRLGVRRKELDPPYETRVVYADDQGGWLDDANEAGNYLRTEWSDPTHPLFGPEIKRGNDL